MKRRLTTRLVATTTVAAHVAAMLASVAHAQMPAGAVAANGNTQVYVAPNGVPVVNIANPNAKGISHNQYTQYNVDSRGIVLNNGGVDQLTRQSQLAGQTLANLNLQSAASVILNEVVSANRSTLAGYTEVLGAKADVIVANPFGITCNGCGFINTDRATLTTGVPTFGSAGDLGFRVNGGDVLISGAGANAGDLNYFNIVTRTLKVDGQLNARALDVVAGTNTWDYAAGSAAALTPTGVAPSYSVDSTALGGIYANRIRIISTEAGVGVRALGEVAASGEDFTLDSAGRIELLGRASAQRDATVRYTGNAAGGAGAITLSGSNASLSAGRNVVLSSGTAAVTLNEGALTAGGVLNVTGDGLNDSSQAAATRFGAGLAVVDVNGAANFSGSSWSSGGGLSVEAATVTLDGANTKLRSASDLSLIARAGDLDVGVANVATAAALFLQAEQGSVLIGAGANPIQASDISVLANTAVTNSGTVLAANGLFVGSSSGTTPVNVNNSGRLQGTTVTLGASPGTVTLRNNAAGTIFGDSVSIAAGELRNSGRIEGTHGATITASSLANDSATASLLTSTQGGSASSINVSGAFENAGTVNGVGALAIGATTISNAAGGVIASQDSLTLAAATSATNEGELNATSALALTSPILVNSGRVESSGTLSINQGAAGATDTRELTNAASGTLLADVLSINSGQIRNSGVMQAAHGATLTAPSLSNLTAGSKFITSANAGSAGVINVSGAIANEGSFHSVGNLTLNAGSVTNDVTGGISSLGTLGFTTTGNLSNAGLLYGETALSVSTPQTFTNSGNVVSGVPGRGAGSMSYSVDTFVNTGVITSEGGMTITARDFRNDPVGGLPTITRSIPQYYLPGRTVISDSGNFNCDVDVLGIEFDCARSYVYQYLMYTDELISGTMPKPAQLLAGGDFSLTYSNQARNVASIISGDNVYITGTAGSQAFQNQDFHLERRVEIARIWERSTDYNDYYIPYTKTAWDAYVQGGRDQAGWAHFPVQANDEESILYGLRLAYRELLPGEVISSTSAGIFSRNLASFHGPSGLNNQAGMKTQTVALTTPALAGVNGVTVPTAGSALGLDLNLPANPNGYFVPAKGSGAGYLIETNPLFTSGDALGSDYLARLLGYNVDTLQKRLGDANYESKLIREQLIAQTGSNILTGYASEAAQVKGLMESASSQAGDLGLTFGKPLTEEQKASLKQDLVWMEEREVRGQKVLVPVVYLAATTRDSVSAGAVIGGRNVSIEGGALTNTAGTIKAGEKLVVEATGDITNTSGAIAGGTVQLRSSDGNVVNQTSAVEGGDDAFRRTTIGETATIAARDGLTIEAGKDVTVKGAQVSAGGTASINAGGNVVIDTIQNRSADSSTSSSSGILTNSVTNTNTQTTTQIGSQVNAGNLNVRGGGDVTIGGSQVNASGDATLSAGNNLNIVDRQNTSMTRTETKSNDITTDGASVSLNDTTTTTVNNKSTSVGSGINIGGNATVEAGNTATVRGSDVAAGGNLNVNAKDINVIAGENTTLDTEHIERTSVGVSASANADSVGVALNGEKFTSDKSDATSTARASTLRSGGDLNRNASGTITDVGTQIEAGGNFSQNATTIDSRAAANTQTSTYSSKSDKVSVGTSIDYGVGTAMQDAQNGSTAGAASASGGPTAGTNASYRNDTGSKSSSASQAVTSTIKAGGKVTSNSSGTTTLEGTQIESGKDTDISASSLNVKAAKDTSTSSESESRITASYRGAVDVTGTPSGTISGGYGDSSSEKAESKAVVGAIKSGGNVNVRTTGDTRLEGTKIESAGDANIDAGGNVKIDAARDTSSAKSESFDASGSITVGKGQGGVSGSLSTSSSSSKSDQAVTGSVNAGGNLNVRAGKNVTTEGTDLAAGKDAKVSAGGTVDMKEAVSTSESESESFNASVSLSGATGGKSGKGGKSGSTRTESGSGNPGSVIGGSGGSSTSEKSSSTTKKESTVQAGGTVTVEERDKPKAAAPAKPEEVQPAPAPK